MTDPDLNNKLDRLLALLEAQLELTRQGQRGERLRRAHLTEEATDLSHAEDQAGGGDESMIGDPHTPTPAPQSRPSVSFNLDEQDDVNYEKYASPTGPRYVKPKVDQYSRTRMDPYLLDQEEDTSIMTERSKPIATPFPKFNPRDVEIFILEAEAWFKFNQVYEQSRMINHMGVQLEGNAREWWTSKLRIDRAREGRLFNDWHYFTERLVMGGDAQKLEDPSSSYEGSAGVKGSGRAWDLKQSSLRSYYEPRISSREDGTMDPTKIGDMREGMADSARIGNRRDPITDSAEISDRNGRTTSFRGGSRTKRRQEGDRAQEHAAGGHSGAHKIGDRHRSKEGGLCKRNRRGGQKEEEQWRWSRHGSGKTDGTTQ
ncbi:uncharacterized protein UDID_17929 [Ustilago sp. UG-2017a]|nr:uncharacterized protein UDID_17929 [Ustilago sp. UG-2017a]